MPEQTRKDKIVSPHPEVQQSPFKTKTAKAAPDRRRLRGGRPQGSQPLGALNVEAVLPGGPAFSSPGKLDPDVCSGLLWLAEVLYFSVLKVDSGLGGLLRSLAVELGDASGREPTLDAPPPMPEGGVLPAFAKIFGLDPLESLLVLAALAPAFDGRFGAAFSALHGMPSLNRPSSDLIGQILGLKVADRARLSSSLRPGRNIEQFALLNLDFSDTPTLPLNRQGLDLPSRLLWYFLDGSDVAPAFLHGKLTPRTPQWTLETAPFDAETRHNLRACLPQLIEPTPLPIVVVEGPMGAGQREVAECLAAAKGLNVLEAHISKLLLGPSGPKLGPVLMREALLQNSLLYLVLKSGDVLDEKGDAIVTEEQYRLVIHFLEQGLRAFPLPMVVTGDYASMSVVSSCERPALFISLKLPERRVQKRTLQRSLSRHALELDSEILQDVLSRYHLNHQSTEDIVRAAKAIIRGKNGQKNDISPGQMERALEIVLSRNLGMLSSRLMANATWNDLVLPNDLMVQLKALRFLVEHRFKLFDEWGVRRVGQGRGVKALFSGPSGTGKTLAAEVIASDVRVPLYKVDLSQLVSKWVGETEKNIDRIFRDAEASQAMLLFDEADSLFGSRGAVDGGNDRWANFQINYLLQRFEVHDGVVILTSNMPNAIDTAFARRMHFLIEFRLPDEEMRKTLWEKVLVGGVPLGDDLDVPFLAERFEISASNISNIVMMGAFLAAADGDILTMRQLVRGIQVEFQKLGKACTKTDFGPYYKHLDLDMMY